MSSKHRQFERFNLAHSYALSGRIAESPVDLRLASLSLGGCGFFGDAPKEGFWPPREVKCSILSPQVKTADFVTGNLIYIHPINALPGESYFYGVRFHDDEREKLREVISWLSQTRV